MARSESDVYLPFPDDDAWIGVEMSESKDSSATDSDEPF